jgi:ABC-type multidrug transport system ATPase subunit
VLFEGTILDNIKIGRSEATMEQIVAAAQQAQIHDTIMEMPDGYNTKVRERGKNFSGGQRQRLAIARAILCDSPILVLDEPTASLDVEAEAEVLHAIDKLVEGRTVLMISHRLSTLGNVDEIIVLKDGLIVEQGSYQDLKRSNGIFAGLLKEQNRYNVDYAGGSMIVPKAELLELQRQIALRQGAQSSAAPMPVASSVSRGRPADIAIQRPIPAGNNKGNQPPNARMLIEVDKKIVSEQRLNKPVLTVGRLASNDIHVPSQRVSRMHAKVYWDNKHNSWMIEDMDSLNGLSYQGMRIDHYALSKGDRIYLAPSVVLQYEPL